MSTASTPSSGASSAAISFHERLLAWKEILETSYPPEERPLDTNGGVDTEACARALYAPYPTLSGRVSRPSLRIYQEPKPGQPPAWYPARGWPLWFVGFAFVHRSRAGGLLTLGLLLNVILPVALPWA